MNAAFAIGRLCDMESGRRQILMLSKSNQMVSTLPAYLAKKEQRHTINEKPNMYINIFN